MVFATIVCCVAERLLAEMTGGPFASKAGSYRLRVVSQALVLAEKGRAADPHQRAMIALNSADSSHPCNHTRKRG